METIKQQTKKKRKLKIIASIFFLLITILILIFFITSFTGQKILKNFLSSRLNSVILTEAYFLRSTVDPKKLNYERLFSKKPLTLNIKVSRKDISKFNEQIRLSQKKGFLDDKLKDWRKIDLQIGQDNFKNIKMKIHGTSLTPINSSYSHSSFVARLLKKININKEKDFGLGELGVSFKLKLKNENFFNGTKNFNLISPNDDWTAGSIVLTKMAEQLGAIVSVPKLYHVYFNGSDAGIYLLSEDIKKEILERNYGINNYGIIKSNDFWDKALSIPHISMTDYTSHDKEQSGFDLASEFGLGQFEILMKHLASNNLQEVIKLIDMNDFARFSAFEHILGTNHYSSGDNLRYLYDFSSGRFGLVLRIEGPIIPRKSPFAGNMLNNPKSNLTGFDQSIGPYANNKIFQLLSKSRDFQDKRRFYLNYIIKHKDKLLKNVKEKTAEIRELSKKTSKSILQKLHISQQGFRNLIFNISEVEKYLSYHKIYTTHVITSSSLEILNESSSKLKLIGIKKCDNEFVELDNKITILPNYYKDEWLKKNVIKIPQNIECIDRLKFTSNGYEIYENNISINRRRDLSFPEISFTEFNKIFERKIKNNSNSREWIIPSGDYTLSKTVIVPSGINLKLEPGVSIKFSPNVGLLVQGNFTALGGKEKINISPLKDTQPFTTLAILGSKDTRNKVKLDNFHIFGGKEGFINNVYFSGQMSIHYADVSIINSQFSRSSSDDGINIKNSQVDIKFSKFYNNNGDQLDCDFCKGQINDSFFEGINQNNSINVYTDGLDFSGSQMKVIDNKFMYFTDKAISIGEKSNVELRLNFISNSNIGIAVKDGSLAKLSDNKYSKNNKNVSSYIKKKMYSPPKIIYD